MITFKQASREDAAALTAVQTRTFDDDARKHDRPEREVPPGYNAPDWQIARMSDGCYYKILEDERIIGGIIVFDLGSGHYDLGRIYIDPDYQNQGIGAHALRFIEQAHPSAQRWTLDTPSWAKRNQHFYEKHGYVRIGVQPLDDFDFSLILYEKVMVSAQIDSR